MKYWRYHLVGHLWWIGPGRADYNDNIDQEIEATDIKDAVKKANEVLKNACKKEDCPRNVNVSCDLYKPTYEIGTLDRWDVMDKKNYKSGNRLGIKLIRKE